METCENCAYMVGGRCGLWGHEITEVCDQYTEADLINDVENES